MRDDLEHHLKRLALCRKEAQRYVDQRQWEINVYDIAIDGLTAVLAEYPEPQPTGPTAEGILAAMTCNAENPQQTLKAWGEAGSDRGMRRLCNRILDYLSLYDERPNLEPQQKADTEAP